MRHDEMKPAQPVETQRPVRQQKLIVTQGTGLSEGDISRNRQHRSRGEHQSKEFKRSGKAPRAKFACEHRGNDQRHGEKIGFVQSKVEAQAGQRCQHHIDKGKYRDAHPFLPECQQRRRCINLHGPENPGHRENSHNRGHSFSSTLRGGKFWPLLQWRPCATTDNGATCRLRRLFARRPGRFQHPHRLTAQ